MSLELVKAFGYARVVGPPVLDRRRFGVPVGGPFDRESAALARALVGLPDKASLWELGMAEATFRSLSCGSVAIVGAPVEIGLDGVFRYGQASMAVDSGARLQISPPRTGARAYVAFGPRTATRRLADLPSSLSEGPLRVVAGPQAGEFDLGSFGEKVFSIGFASDRVGVRLDGVFAPHKIELPSEPACVGAIQVTGSGELIVLGPDGPTIGGYPKIAVVIDADRDRIGQLRPGQQVRFEVVSLEEAARLRMDYHAGLARLSSALAINVR